MLSTTAPLVHAAGALNVVWRRHLPSWMTIGMFVPTGTFFSVNVPSTAVVVDTSGLPVTGGQLQDAPAVKGWIGAFGTYPSTPGTGSGVPYVGSVPATTLPVTVVGVPPSHATCCLQSPVHVVPVPHTPGD